jgi:hypothetical protein
VQQTELQIRALIGYLDPAYLRLLPDNVDDKIQDLEKFIRQSNDRPQ